VIGELIVIAVVVLLPAAVILGSLALVALGVAGFALDPDERRLFAR
jgi:hypothetical protein